MATEPTFHPQLTQEFGLAGRVAVITGAASGIGRETAHVLAQAGAKVVLADVDSAGLEQTRQLVVGDGGTALVQPTDVSQRAEVEALAEAALTTFGKLDIWVNCAGILVKVAIVDATEEQIDRVIAVNLKGVYAGCAVAGRVMQAAGSGAIVNISSGGADSAPPGLSIYSMTKAGVNVITKAAAAELGPQGIRVNAIAPGWVDTPLACHGFRDEAGAIDPTKYAEGVRQRERVSPLGITGVPRDIALAALYLVSDAARFVTGQIIRPNGGVSMP